MNNNNSKTKTLTKENVDSSIQLILEKNFDINSKICVITLLKIIDNVIQKPNNNKVRTIRTSNTTIQQKIINNYGHHFLIACGFIIVEKAEAQMTMSDGNDDERLVLNEIQEDTEFLIYARHTLARIAVYELNIKADTLPSFRPPPPKVTFGIGESGNTSTTTTNTGFNVYEGKRFDGQAAATGTNLGPPSGWKSKTETELEILQKRELKLEKELALATKNNNNSTSSSSAKTSKTTTTTTAVDRQWTSNKEDKQLLAKHFQTQFAKQKAAQSIGFTTKAMRDLTKIKKSKVYSHTQLAITFPDGIIVKANFSTTEKLSMVMKGIIEHVLFSNTDTITFPKFELYISPPRTILDPTQSLKKLGLVPAAKIYVSWNSPGLTKIPTFSLGQGWYILPELLLFSSSNSKKNNTNANSSSATATGTGSSMTTIMGPVMPISVSVLGGGGNIATGASLRNDTNPKPTKQVKKKSKAEKEAELMKRMLGGR
ncbi:hypothetical protein FRACYDRAFT_194726 [Fragilariopsis cylindrus CCMP1102]|uniref:UBX domain-containing protein n=1 Tax=Fragilariopsis cylindrus CCMP1102 TaxID=635003 RepID=A0A1E7EV54_9STRA|nr:hypothetical protein FRACYDRAFT_194726 [Fragilariopsis cylindrus CCMP1102]|eukprot:OEU09746.1 hypothetical protein FRACYDRAFT_194726 [Fragilariopsis cylindrus CCMP1102]